MSYITTMPRLCSFGCRPLGVTLHSFPNPDKCPDRFKTWVSLVGGKLESSSDYEYFRKMKVCDIHFTDQERNRNNRLNALAVPSLHLTGVSVIPAISNQNILPEAQELQPSAASENSVVATSQAHACNQEIHSGTTCDEVNVAAMMMEHSYSVAPKRKRTLYKEDVSQKKPNYNYTCLKPLKKQVKYLRTEISRLRKRSQSFKDSLANAKKLADDLAFQKTVGIMRKPALLFL